MAVNKVDYEVLTTGVSTYGNQAEAISEALNALITMNGQLQEGWTNQTADAFIQNTNLHWKTLLKQFRVFLIIFRVICKHVKMMMPQVQRLLEVNYISTPKKPLAVRKILLMVISKTSTRWRKWPNLNVIMKFQEIDSW